MDIFSKKICQNIFKEPCMRTFKSELMDLLIPLNSSLQSNIKVKTSMETLRQSRKNLVDVLVLYQLIYHCLFSSGMDVGQSQASPLILSDLKKILVACQIQEFFPIISLDGTEESSILDIDTQSFVNKAKKSISSHHQIALLSMIKSYLECSCHKIVQFTFPSNSLSLSVGMWEVTKYISNIQEETNEKRILLSKQREYNASLLAKLFKEMSEYAVLLEYIISNNRFSKNGLLHLQCLSVSLKAYWLKLRCLEVDVLCNTYTRVSIPALSKVDRKLTQRITLAADTLASVKNQLSKYDNMDDRFQNLVKEHACLRKDLQFFYDSQQT